MQPEPKQLSEAEEKRILAEFYLQQAKEAHEKKKKAKWRYPSFALLLNSVLLVAAGVAYAGTEGRIGFFAVFVLGFPLFFTLLAMFNDLCRDVKEIKEEIRKNET